MAPDESALCCHLASNVLTTPAVTDRGRLAAQQARREKRQQAVMGEGLKVRLKSVWRVGRGPRWGQERRRVETVVADEQVLGYQRAWSF